MRDALLLRFSTLTGWALCLTLLVPVIQSNDLQAADTMSRVRDQFAGPSEARAEITFPVPKRYAIVLQVPDKIRALYGPDDILFYPGDSTKSLRFLEVHPDTVILHDNRSGLRWVTSSGSSFPGMPGLSLVGTVPLTQLRYRYKVVERVTYPEPILVSLKGSVAILEKEVLPGGSVAKQGAPSSENSPPRSKTLPMANRTLSKLLRVKQIDPDTYEMESADILPALRNTAQVLSDLNLMVSPRISPWAGVGFDVSSKLADGTLNQNGFTVTNSKLAETFGIQVGDRVVKINNQPVTSPLNAWWVYQKFLVKNRRQSEIRVDIRRGTSVVRKTYRVR